MTPFPGALVYWSPMYTLPAHIVKWRTEPLSTYQPAVLIEGRLAFTSSASPLKPRGSQPNLLLEQCLSMSRVAMDILTFTTFTSGLRAAPRITGDDQPRASTLLTADVHKLGPSTGCLGSAPPCPTLSTCHLRKLTRVMCLCLHVSQAVLIKGRLAL